MTGNSSLSGTWGGKRSKYGTLEFQSSMITIRCSTELRERLKAMAKMRGISMNELCVSVLVKLLESDKA